jgi:GT2 family glycosyltransferase
MTDAAPRAASISVIVPTYNRAHCIQACLDSLLAQTVPALEILVVDDGSSDDTRQRVAAYGDKLSYIHKANGGKPSAVNLGLQRARGEWVWIFDDDDVAMPQANALRLQALAAQPGAGFVYGGHRVWPDGTEPSPAHCRQHLPPPPEPGALFFELMRSCFWHLGTALVRRELMLELGGLDPALLSGEDYDLQMRLARVARPAYCAAPMFYFRSHNGARGAPAIRYAAADRAKVFRRFSHLLGLKLRSTVPLAEYLVPPHAGTPDGALSAHARAGALLNRIEVMCNHGCMAEMLQDVEALLRLHAQSGRALSPHERTCLSRAMRAGWAFDASSLDWPAFINHARQLKRQPGARQALVSMGLGWLRLAWGHPDTSQRRVAKALHGLMLATA